MSSQESSQEPNLGQEAAEVPAGNDVVSCVTSVVGGAGSIAGAAGGSEVATALAVGSAALAVGQSVATAVQTGDATALLGAAPTALGAVGQAAGGSEVGTALSIGGAALAVGQSVASAVQTGDATALLGAVPTALGAVGQAVGGTAGQAISTAVSAATQVVSTARQVAAVAESASDAPGLLEATNWLERPRFDPRVEYRVATSNTREGVLSSEDWRVENVRFTEALNEAYHLELLIGTAEGDQDPTALVGADVRLTIDRRPLQRTLRGIVRSVTAGGTSPGWAYYRVWVVPAFELMAHRITSRIFQNKTAKEILEAVLSEGLEPFGRAASLELHGEYAKREYCVQYQESDYAFCSRLMEEEGIVYFFTHDDERETLHLVDYAQKEGESPFPVYSPTEGLAFTVDAEGRGGAESCICLERERTITTEGITAVQWDWTRGTSEKDERKEEKGVSTYLHLDHHDRALLQQYEKKRYVTSNLGSQTDLRLAQLHQPRNQFRGQSSVTGFSAGSIVEFAGHSNPELDGHFLLTRVEHRDSPLESDGPESNYSNSFTCIPVAQRFAALPIHLQPTIAGIQVARVCGPENDVAYTDEWGRIKLWFSTWDYTPHNKHAGDHKKDQHTCWVRVQQMLAGSHYGSLFLPHVGMDVVVGFENGDPDRPLVIGAYYGANHPPPHAADEPNPTGHTQYKSAIVTQSRHELRFDDTPDKELIRLHSTKDHERDVVNDETVTVGHDQSIRVQNDRRVSVHANQKHLVQKNDQTTVQEKRFATVNGGKNVTTVQGTHQIVVQGDPGKLFADAAKEIVLRVGKTSLTMDGNQIHLHASGGADARLTSTIAAISHDGAGLELSDLASLQDPDLAFLRLSQGDMKAESAHGGAMWVTSSVAWKRNGTSLEVNDDNLTASGTSIAYQSGGAVCSLHQKQAVLSATLKSVLQGASGSAVCGPADVTVASSAMCNVKGIPINIGGVGAGAAAQAGAASASARDVPALEVDDVIVHRLIEDALAHGRKMAGNDPKKATGMALARLNYLRDGSPDVNFAAADHYLFARASAEQYGPPAGIGMSVLVLGYDALKVPAFAAGLENLMSMQKGKPPSKPTVGSMRWGLKGVIDGVKISVGM